ncbi:ribonuclease H [Devosia sp.]|uniref:ribonuclease H family protein n=1 Tax=Devosia sp. TaxID=1871048 RepID=UPI001AFE588D|nr:ribonuclease H [Devosia sp.]MBO9589450.1 ribonuclease HI [Devosia sp.]
MHPNNIPSPLAGQRHYILATDGACLPNPGPGGWGAIRQLVEADGTISAQSPFAGFQPATTSVRMEMLAAIKGLSRLTIPELPTLLLTDNQMVVKGMTEWLVGWKERGWKTADKKPVKNLDLWLELDALAQTRAICWQWVKGHAGHELNEMADTLANNGALRVYAKAGSRLKDRHPNWYLGDDALVLEQAA